MNNSKNIFKLITVFIIGLLVGAGIIFLINNRNVEDIVLEQIISAEEAGKKVLSVINQQTPPEVNVSLIETITERGLHKITFEVEGQRDVVYVTKDGSLLFPQMAAVDLDALLAVPAPAPVPVEKGPQPEFTQEELRRLAKRLTEEGAIFFSKGWCPFCLEQLQMFGEAVKYLPYVECCPEHGATEQELALCRKKNVGTVPDWRFPGKEPILGMLSIERLIELSGCELLKDRIR